MLSVHGLWSRATCTHLLCHKFLGLTAPAFSSANGAVAAPPTTPVRLEGVNSHEGEPAGWTQVRAQQTQAATVLSSVKPSLKAACAVRHLGPSAPPLFTENLLCARHQTGASPWTGRQVVPPPGLVSSRTYLRARCRGPRTPQALRRGHH